MDQIRWFDCDPKNRTCSWCGCEIKSEFIPFKLTEAIEKKEAIFHFECGIIAGVIPDVARLLLDPEYE